MILTCPECQTRYNAKNGMFDGGARKVKCANCGHVWLQEPEEEAAEALPEPLDDGEVLTKPAAKPKPKPKKADEGEDDLQKTFDSLPALPDAEDTDEEGEAAEDDGSFEEAMAKARSARPRAAVADETFLIEEFGDDNKWLSADRLASVTIAIMVCVGIVAAAVQYRVELSRSWPSLAGAYAAIGVPVNATGMEIRNPTWEIETRDGMPMLTVRGEIINTTDIDRAVPRLRFSVRDAVGAELYHWSIVPEVKRLDPAERSRFTTFLPSPPPEAHDIHIQFATGGN